MLFVGELLELQIGFPCHFMEIIRAILSHFGALNCHRMDIISNMDKCMLPVHIILINIVNSIEIFLGLE